MVAPFQIKNRVPRLELLEDRCCPALFQVIGATGSPTQILDVKILDSSGGLVSTVRPFDNLTSLRVATGDFDGNGRPDEFAVLGRRTNSDLRAEIVTYRLTEEGQAQETSRFFAFEASILGNGYIAVGDLDGDGDDDIAVGQIGGGRSVVTIQMHLSAGDGASFTTGGSTVTDYGVISAPRIGVGDTDGDGLEEIVVSARTPAGADVRVFDAENLTPVIQGNFIWTFGIDNYSRGAFVTVGEFNPLNIGEEIILGSNVGGGGRVDFISVVDGAPTLFERSTPFGDGYNAAVRVAVSDTGPRLLAGQDRFQNGQTVVLEQDFSNDPDRLNPKPPLVLGTPAAAISSADGLAPATSPDGNRTLGPFVAYTDPIRIRIRGGQVASNPNNLNSLNNSPPNAVNSGQEGGFIALTSGNEGMRSLPIESGPFEIQPLQVFPPDLRNLVVNMDISGSDLSGLAVTLRYVDAALDVVQQARLFLGGGVGPATQRLNAAFFSRSNTELDTISPVPATTTQIGQYLGVDDLAVFNDPAVVLGQGDWVLVLDNQSGGGQVVLNNWSLTFDDSDAAAVPPVTTLGDFDGDGLSDELAVLARRADDDPRAEIVTYNVNTATGALTETSRFFALPGGGVLGDGSIAAGDFDGDGDDDIIVAQIGGGSPQVTLQIHLSDGAGGFTFGPSTSIDFGQASAPRVAAGNVDIDGFDEIVVTARTTSGVDVRVIDANSGSLVIQGGFVWDFGIAGYARGASVAVGEFDAGVPGGEIVLGADTSGRVDVVTFDAGASLSPNGRFLPFPGYTGPIRVSVGTFRNGEVDAGSTVGGNVGVNVILSDQNGFPSSQAVYSKRNIDLGNPQNFLGAFITGAPFALATDFGPAPASNSLRLVRGKALRDAGGILNSFETFDLTQSTTRGNTVPTTHADAFVIPAANLALPAGATFKDVLNSMYVNVDTFDSGFTNVSFSVQYYPDATSGPVGPSLDDIVLVNGGEINPATFQITGQFAPGFPNEIDALAPDGFGILASYFNTSDPSEPLSQFFQPAAAAVFGGTGFFVLIIDNSTGTSDVFIDDFELLFHFA